MIYSASEAAALREERAIGVCFRLLTFTLHLGTPIMMQTAIKGGGQKQSHNKIKYSEE